MYIIGMRRNRDLISYISRKPKPHYTANIAVSVPGRGTCTYLYLQHFFQECSPLLQYANSPRILPYGAPSPFIVIWVGTSPFIG